MPADRCARTSSGSSTFILPSTLNACTSLLHGSIFSGNPYLVVLNPLCLSREGEGEREREKKNKQVTSNHSLSHTIAILVTMIRFIRIVLHGVAPGAPNGPGMGQHGISFSALGADGRLKHRRDVETMAWPVHHGPRSSCADHFVVLHAL